VVDSKDKHTVQYSTHQLLVLYCKLYSGTLILPPNGKNGEGIYREMTSMQRDTTYTTFVAPPSAMVGARLEDNMYSAGVLAHGHGHAHGHTHTEMQIPFDIDTLLMPPPAKRLCSFTGGGTDNLHGVYYDAASNHINSNDFDASCEEHAQRRHAHRHHKDEAAGMYTYTTQGGLVISDGSDSTTGEHSHSSHSRLTQDHDIDSHDHSHKHHHEEEQEDRIAHSIPKTKLHHIQGHVNAKLHLEEALLPLALPPGLAQRVFGGIRGGGGGSSSSSSSSSSNILLYGPPGCGKTQLARAVAGEIGAPLVSVAPSDILSKFVGESEASIRHVFDQVKRLARHSQSDVDDAGHNNNNNRNTSGGGCAVLFLDEVDALGQSRGGGSGSDGNDATGASSGGNSRQVLAELLIQLTDLKNTARDSDRDNNDNIANSGDENNSDDDDDSAFHSLEDEFADSDDDDGGDEEMLEPNSSSNDDGFIEHEQTITATANDGEYTNAMNARNGRSAIPSPTTTKTQRDRDHSPMASASSLLEDNTHTNCVTNTTTSLSLTKQQQQPHPPDHARPTTLDDVYALTAMMREQHATLLLHNNNTNTRNNGNALALALALSEEGEGTFDSTSSSSYDFVTTEASASARITATDPLLTTTRTSSCAGADRDAAVLAATDTPTSTSNHPCHHRRYNGTHISESHSARVCLEAAEQAKTHIDTGDLDLTLTTTGDDCCGGTGTANMEPPPPPLRTRTDSCTSTTSTSSDVDGMLLHNHRDEKDHTTMTHTKTSTSHTSHTSLPPPRIIVIAATNRPSDCDPALLRRFQTRILIDFPTLDDRKRIVARLLVVTKKNKKDKQHKKCKHQHPPSSTLRDNNDNDNTNPDAQHCITKRQLHHIAEMTQGFSGSDLEALTHEAIMAPVRQALRQSSLLARKEQQTQKKMRSMSMTKRQRQRQRQGRNKMSSHNHNHKTVTTQEVRHQQPPQDHDHVDSTGGFTATADDHQQQHQTHKHSHRRCAAREHLHHQLHHLRPVSYQDFVEAFAFYAGDQSINFTPTPTPTHSNTDHTHSNHTTTASSSPSSREPQYQNNSSYHQGASHSTHTNTHLSPPIKRNTDGSMMMMCLAPSQQHGSNGAQE
jgi:SpoVK/Ycf46/Vps4 family AAA+-type ATPase